METEMKKKATEEDVFTDGLAEEEENEPDGKETEEEVKTKGIFKLKKPINGPEGTIKEIPYDFESVRPITYINVVKAISKKENVPVPELNLNVQFTFFCKAARMPVAVLKQAQNVSDFVGMCTLARDFLLSKSGEDEEEHL